MSKLVYIAADVPLEEVDNPHYKTMSVNEALAAHIEVPRMLLQSDVDRDKPGVILWSDAMTAVDAEKGIFEDAGYEDDFSITAMEKGGSEDILTEKKYCASLQWRYSQKRAEHIIAYIKKLLVHTDEVEIWNIWMGDPMPKIKRAGIAVDKLTPQVLKQIDEPDINQLESVQYRGDLPVDWNIEQEDLEQNIQYCFIIRSNEMD